MKTTVITRNLLLDSLNESDDFAQMIVQNKYTHGQETYLLNIRTRVSKLIRAHLHKIGFHAITDYVDTLIMSGGFIPAGSILYGLGATGTCSLSNCYYTPILEDSLEGIFDAQKHLARTFSYRGGSGISLNILRPETALVNNAAKESSGAVSFMPSFNECVRSIGQNGRRGALLMSMDIRHPDSPKFILSKHKPEQVFERDAITGSLPNIEGANLSLMVNSEFIKAVFDDKYFELWFPDIEATGKEVYNEKWDGDFDAWEKAGLPKKVYQVLKARELIQMIAEAAHACGDPGLIFKDTVEGWTFGTYINEKLTPRGSNPCVTGDTLILTDKGHKPIQDCVGQETIIWNGFEWTTVIPRVTGENQEVLRVEFNNGLVLKPTLYHGFRLRAGNSLHQQKSVEAGSLQENDPLIKFSYPIIKEGESVDKKYAYTLGFFAGDGYYSLKKGKYPHYGITLYDEKIKLLDSLEYSHSCGPYPPSGKVMVTLDKDKFWDKLFIPFQYDLPSKIAWLEGICDADGGCQAKKGESTWSSIGITSINEQFLRDIQLLLCTMGCQSSVSLMKEECVKPMPDGRGGEKEYACATSYRLLIPAHSVSILSLECGFSPKRLKVKQGWVKARCSKIVRVKSVERTGEIAEKVYCFTDPKRGMGMFNGIATLNCGEQMLPNWANCLLGCMVLTKYSTPDGTFDYTRFLTDVKTAVYILNVFSEMNRERHPLQPQREMDEFSRRIGIEMTGIGDVLAALGMTYGSTEAVQFLSDLAKRKAIAELEASVEAVAKFGVAPALEPREARERFVECNYYTNLVDGYECRDILTNAILDTGLANTAFNTMGPCGSISIISGNLTSGGEPLYKFAYARKNKIDGKTYEMIHRPAVVRMLEDFNRFKGKTLEEAKVMLGYVEANEVDPMDRLRMQSALQEYTDASISSTLNLPENTTPQEISKIYLEAYELGLKGVTVFRENCKVGVLGAISEKQKTSALPLPAPGTLIKRGLFDVEEATRYRVFWKKAKLYVIVSTDGDEMPIEVFAKLPVEAGANGDGQFNPTLWQERTSNWDLACRLISMLLRYGIPLEEVLEQLQKSAYTMVDVASVLKRVLAKYRPSALPDELDEGDGSEGVRGAKCPECKQMALFHEGGCAMCRECGFTTCG